MNVSRFLSFFSVLMTVGLSGYSQTYDAKADFSTASNPNGLWSYGWSSTLSGPVTVYPDVEDFAVYDAGWCDNSNVYGYCPCVIYYSGTVTDESGVPPESMVTAPGLEGQISHCIWTAPVSGTYSIQGSFMAPENGVPDAYLLVNGTEWEDVSLSTPGQVRTFSFASVPLAAGDTADSAVGIGSSFYYADDVFSLTISTVAASGSSGAIKPGSYAGLIVGSGSTSGLLTARVGNSGAFTAVMDINGRRIPIAGALNSSSLYSGTTVLGAGKQVSVQIAPDSKNDLTATVTYNSTTYRATAGIESDSSSAGGRYSFIITTGTVAAGQPLGAGFGTMRVPVTGGVTLKGVLANGTPFTASSVIVSGSVVPLYVRKSSGQALTGNLTFQDVPDVSDCSGNLVWSTPPNNSQSAYAAGFFANATFTAAQFNSTIPGLAGSTVSFSAFGANMPQGATSSDSIVMHTIGASHHAPVYSGAKGPATLTLEPGEDIFFGSFLDPVNDSVHAFTGALLPKSRTGAGYFFARGLSGEVDIQY